MRESDYWLRIINATLPSNLKNDELKHLIDESGQLKKILGSIVSKTSVNKEKVVKK